MKFSILSIYLLTLYFTTSSFCFSNPFKKRDDIDDALIAYSQKKNGGDNTNSAINININNNGMNNGMTNGNNNNNNNNNGMTNGNNNNNGMTNNNNNNGMTNNNNNNGMTNGNNNNNGMTNGNNNNNNGMTNGNNNNNNISITPECQKVLDEYNVCFNDLTIENYDKTCDIFNTDQCQNLLQKTIKSNPSCKDLDDSQLHLQDFLDWNVVVMNLSCAKNEEGGYCPLSIYGKSLEDKELSNEEIKETCNSELCRSKALDSFTMYKKLNDKLSKEGYLFKRKNIPLESVESALIILSSNQCIDIASNAIASKLNIISLL